MRRSGPARKRPQAADQRLFIYQPRHQWFGGGRVIMKELKGKGTLSSSPKSTNLESHSPARPPTTYSAHALGPAFGRYG